MGKLYELLAVERELKAAAETALKAVKGAFGNETRFMGRKRSYTRVAEETRMLEDEAQNLGTTVAEQLALLEEGFGPWLDAVVQKEKTNTFAQADVELDGEAFLEGLPATALLNLEGKLEQLRGALVAIPTFDPSGDWRYSEDRECWVTEPTTSYRHEKQKQVIVVVEPTEYHPAQTAIAESDVLAGKWRTEEWTGKVPPAEKREMIKRLDKLAQEVKKARMRANDRLVHDVHVAEKVFTYILHGIE